MLYECNMGVAEVGLLKLYYTIKLLFMCKCDYSTIRDVIWFFYVMKTGLAPIKFVNVIVTIINCMRSGIDDVR